LSSCESVISAFQPFLLSIMTGLFQDLQNLKKPEQISNKDFWSLFIQLNNYESINDIIVTCGGILIGIIIFSTALAFFLRITSRFFHIKSAIDIVQRLRNELFWKLQWIKDDEFNKLSVSSIVSRATNDSYQFQETVLIVFMFFFESLLLIIGSLIFCVVLNWMLSSIFLVIIPLVLVVNFICNKKAKKYYSQNLEELDSVNRVMRENIAGTKTVRSFRLQKFQLERFDIHNLTWYKSIYKGEFTIYFGIIFLFYILNVAIILVLFISGTLNNFSVLGQKIDVSQVIAFANYLIYAVFCAFGISNALVSINRTKPCIERINEILNKNSENAEGKDFKEPFTPSIEFKNVSYSYGTSEDKKPIIDKISFKVNPGEIVGIIGPTGSGKSTIVLLASNLAEPEKGEIIFSNQTSSEVSSINIRKQISVAFQEKFIFSGTIKSNILMGNKSASDEKIKWAAKLACADEFIERSENKYDSYVLQNGNNFSGGQKQRLSIARTFTKDAGIYILDDSLSALDNLTRDKVLKNIKNNFKGKTFIIVSQQVKTIKDADKIIVLDKGKIIDIGTHSQLVKKCSLYNKIYDSQKTIGE
ncbi:MAG: ABC transporter ATP-binding protein/permease, partial [Malacoplasma sp.]|nr:ABC transporter ATP-binding protein/permease [Malacoplasma sp.]